MDLRLAVKGEYFDQIRRGVKLEEYRERNEYWTKRLVGRSYTTVTITKGYPKKGDPDREITFKYNSYVERNITHKHFDGESVPVFAIDLSERIK